MFCYWEETFVPIPELLLNPDSSAFPLDKPVICVEEHSTLLPTTSDESSEWLCDSNIIPTCFRCSWVTFISDLYLESGRQQDPFPYFHGSERMNPIFFLPQYVHISPLKRFRNHASLVSDSSVTYHCWQYVHVTVLNDGYILRVWTNVSYTVFLSKQH